MHAKVRDLLERAVNIDPNYAGAWAMLSIVYGDEVRGGYNFLAEPPPLDRALNAAKTAIELDPTNAAGHHALFMTHFNRGEISAYQRAAKQALALNPNYPDLLADYGACLGFTGNWDQGISYVLRAVELSPHPPGWYKAVLAIYHYLHGRYEDALAQTESIDLGSFFWGQLIRAIIHGQLENEKAATEAIDKVKREIPHFEKIAAGSLRLWNIQGKDADHIMDGWRKAGLNLQSA